MINQNNQKVYSPCKGKCACAEAREKEEEMTCASKGAVVLDEGGKCPCGKSLDECCHKDEIKASQNDAIGELCDPASGKNIC